LRALRVAGRHQARRRREPARAAHPGVEVDRQALVVLDGRGCGPRRRRGGDVLRRAARADAAAARPGRPQLVGAGPVKAAPLVACSAAALALGCTTSLPPLGEALLVVDTDLPVPHIASRLRVDLYTDDLATWYVSREIATLDPSAWPVSFSVFDP